MAGLLDITEEIKRKRFNELMIELILSCTDKSPEELLILIEQYYNNQEVINEFQLFRQAD